MLKIRLSRRGRKKINVFSVVVTEHTAPIQGKFMEKLGHYDPRTKDLVIDMERVEYWISKGAKPSDSMARLLLTKGLLKNAEKYIKEIKIPEKGSVKKEEEVQAEETKVNEPENEEVKEESSENEEVPVEETPSEEKTEEMQEKQEASEDEEIKEGEEKQEESEEK